MSQPNKELPLQTERFVRTDKATGLQVPVTRNRRGILVSDTSHYSLHNLMALSAISPRERLERLRTHLRDQLTRLGLPLDQPTYWIKLPDREWEPYAGQQYSQSAFIIQDWLKRIETVVEPLSEGHRAGKLLRHINLLLDETYTADQLWRINELLECYFEYQVGGKINELAMSGFKGVEARKAGPRARSLRTAEKREIIWRQTEAFWRKHPAYKKQARTAADHICKPVNEELGALGLLPKSGKQLSPKTIADHISAVCRGKKTATG